MKKLLYAITITLISISTFAQEKAVTESGDTIMIYSDRTWKPLASTHKLVDIETTVKVTVEVDEFDKTKKITTENWAHFGINKKGKTISGSMLIVNDLATFLISFTGDLGCLSRYSSTMKVKLSNGKIIEFAQISDTKCGDQPLATFIPVRQDQTKDPNLKKLIAQNLSLLRQYDWITIRLEGTQFYTDLAPNSTNKVKKPAQFFRQHLIAAAKN